MNIKIYNKTIKSTLINFVFNINGAQITTVTKIIFIKQMISFIIQNMTHCGMICVSQRAQYTRMTASLPTLVSPKYIKIAHRRHSTSVQSVITQPILH